MKFSGRLSECILAFSYLLLSGCSLTSSVLQSIKAPTTGDTNSSPITISQQEFYTQFGPADSSAVVLLGGADISTILESVQIDPTGRIDVGGGEETTLTTTQRVAIDFQG